MSTRNAALVAALLLALASSAAAQSYNFKWVGYLPPVSLATAVAGSHPGPSRHVGSPEAGRCPPTCLSPCQN